jgi:hypothetical protein
MSNNTKARSEQLNALAAEIAARENVDITEPQFGTRYYADMLATADGWKCKTIEAYRSAWARFLRRSRHPLNTWGGPGRGQGRKPTPGAADGEDTPAKPA